MSEEQNRIILLVRPRYATRLRDIQAKLVGVCWSCHREGEVDVLGLVDGYGEHEQIRWLEKRLRCRKCKGPGHFRVEW